MLTSAIVKPPGTRSSVTFSPSWTLVPTHWCRNRCGYCVFVEREGARAELLSPEAARAEMERAHRAGATELLVMSGEGVEESRAVRAALREHGFSSYIEYLAAISRLALARDMLPHINIGNAREADIRALREFVPSMGMMMETTDAGLRRRAAHMRAPDKEPARRFETLCAAGRARMPFTTGLLVGIGESVGAREETLRVIAQAQREYGHVQEVIVQPFTPHEGTAMAHHHPPSFRELRETVVMARDLLPPEVVVQIPPNIAPRLTELIEAGARDLGGISPDGDRINPRERWLAPRAYASALARANFRLRARLAVHERYIEDRWLSAASIAAAMRTRDRLPLIEADGAPRPAVELSGVHVEAARHA